MYVHRLYQTVFVMFVVVLLSETLDFLCLFRCLWRFVSPAEMLVAAPSAGLLFFFLHDSGLGPPFRFRLRG